MTGARPLESGEHAAGVTFGGAFIDPGLVLPLPMLIAEGRHGMGEIAGRPWDFGYGVNLTAFALGALQGHAGASWLLTQQNDTIPALSLTNRVYFATNAPGLGSRVDPELQLWALDQVELSASWKTGQHLPYVAVAQYFDLGDPSLLLTPAAGMVLDFGAPGGLTLQPEVRWYGATASAGSTNIPFVPGKPGALGASLSVGRTFGAEQ